jgi:thiol-disulfide isomerase/thioredoxin
MKRNKRLLLLLVTMCVCFLSSFVADVNDRPVAPGFTLESIDGKKVSLSDFKGKIVYIDFWATWCGPCIAEMPHSKKLKEKFVGNDSIVFMYVSVDNEESIDDWKSLVKKKGMSGVQLISRDGSEERVADRYGISFIPRFVLVDKNGKIAYLNAPPPSAPEAEILIRQLLQE